MDQNQTSSSSGGLLQVFFDGEIEGKLQLKCSLPAQMMPARGK